MPAILDYPHAEWDLPAIAAYEILTGRTIRDWTAEPGPVRNTWRLAVHLALDIEARRLQGRTDVCRGCGTTWPGSLAPDGLCPACYPHARPGCQCPWCATDDSTEAAR